MSHKTWKPALLTSAAVCLLATSAIAQDAEPADQAVASTEEVEPRRLTAVTVSAQKREQNLQDVPISISAYRGDMLREQGIDSPTDFNAKVPNVNLGFNTGEQASVEVRGIASTFFAQNTDSPAGFYIDEVYTAARSAQLPQFFDLERVEVLRGPQGTLYGRNTTAGAFNFISRKPTGDGQNGFIDVTVAEYGQVDIQGAFETPLSDQWSLRIAGQSRQREGLGRNGDGGKINDRDDLAGRISLRFQGGNTDATLRVFGNTSSNGGIYWKEGFSDPSGTNPLSAFFWDPTFVPDPDPFVVGANQQINEVDNLGATLSVDYDFEAVTLTSITSVLNSDNYMTHEFDGRPERLGVIDPFSSEVEQFSQEFRLTSNGSGPLSWILGANFFESEVAVDNRYVVDAVTVGVPLNIGDLLFNVDAAGAETTTSTAIFADLNYDLTDRARVNLGLRYTNDEKDINYSVSNPLTVFADPAALTVGSQTAADFGLSVVPGTGGTVVNLDHSETWEEPTWKLGFEYDLADDVMGFATYSRGYRSGGFNMGPWFGTSEGLPFNPEQIDSYEVGLKSTLWDGRLTANLSAFYYEFEDIQINVPQAIGLTIANAGASEAKGAELEISGILTDNWDINFAAGWLDGEFTEFVTDIDRSGEKFGQPDFTANLYTEHRFPISAGDIFVRGDITYRGEERFGSTPAFFQTEEAYWRVDGQIGFRWNDMPLEALIFARNIGDESYLTVTDVVPPWMLQQSFTEPRILGARLTYRWND